MKKIAYKIFIFLILTACLVLGILLGFRYETQNEEIDKITEITAEDEMDEKKDDFLPVNTKTYDIEVVYKDKYTFCGHEIIKTNTIYGTTIDKIKEEMSDEYEIEEETNERVVLVKTINQNCPNHFLVKIQNNEIIIYNIIDEGTLATYKIIEVDPNTLNPEMLEELNEGIKADGKEELNLIIEDIES